MKTMLRISICLNVGLLAGLIFVAMNQQKAKPARIPSASAEIQPPAQTLAAPASAAVAKETSKPFRWSQLESTNDYRIYVANLRAIGCPEPTVRDIVSDDAERGFSFERTQLGLDGSGSGKWSRLQQSQTVATLLGKPVRVAQTPNQAQVAGDRSQPDNGTEIAKAQTGTQSAEQPSDALSKTQTAKQPPQLAAAYSPSYPLVFQKVDLDALGLTADQKTAIQQIQQQFVTDVGDPNQNPSDPAYLANWQTAQSNTDDALRNLLGFDGYMAYEQQQYYAWYEPQVRAADAAGKQLVISPDSFSAEK